MAFAVLIIEKTQGQTNDCEKFVENQKTPFLSGDGESFILDGVVWERKFGESEYVLTPTMSSISAYNQRIHQFDDAENGIAKSNFHFVKVLITEQSKNLLAPMGIVVPDYAKDTTIIYLPEIDIDKLTDGGFIVGYSDNYGCKKFVGNDINEKTSVIFSESFESNEVPSSMYTTTIGTINCGWGDENCIAHTGSWSVWCAFNGAACDACVDGYMSDMGTELYKSYNIPTASYVDLWFKFWMKFRFNTAESTDYLQRYYWLGSSWVLSATSYNSNSTNNGGGWSQYSFFYSGTHPEFNFDFFFYSDGSWVSDGVYIDDIELSGTSTAAISENMSVSDISVYPNPATNHISVLTDIIVYDVSIIDALGNQVAYSKEKDIDCSTLPAGVYYIQANTEKGIRSFSFVKEK